jgi:hypothetical protein
MSVVATTAIVTRLTELAAMQAKTAELEKNILAERNAAMVQLPAQFGFQSNDDFIAAFRDATNGTSMVVHGRNGNGRKTTATKRASGNGRKTTNGKRHRASITPERREEIKKWFKAEKGTVLEAAQTFEISAATAQNIKEEAGMVNHR